MIKGFSLEITSQLTTPVAELFAQWIGAANVIRNQKQLHYEAQIKAWKASDQTAPYPKPDQAVAFIASQVEMPFLKELPSQIRRNVGSNWMRDICAWQSGLGGMPKIKGRNKKRSCTLTTDLFTVDKLGKDRSILRIRTGIGKKQIASPVFEIVLPFASEQAAKQVVLSRRAARFFLSISYQTGARAPKKSTLIKQLVKLSPEELLTQTTGYDYGLVTQFTTDKGVRYYQNDTMVKRLHQLEARKIRYQRELARKNRANDKLHAANAEAAPGRRPRTMNERKAGSRIAKIAAKQARIRNNTSHHISKQIAEGSLRVAAFEDTDLRKWGVRNKARNCPETGTWQPNGSKKKARLNRVLFNLNIGQILTLAEYKLLERGKILVKVPAANISRECHVCHYIQSANHPTQSEFICQSCGHVEHAGIQAGKVIRQRVPKVVLSPEFAKAKKVTRTVPRRKVPKASDTASSGEYSTTKTSIALAPYDSAKTDGFPGYCSERIVGDSAEICLRTSLPEALGLQPQ